jgi:acyl carrier protein
MTLDTIVEIRKIVHELLIERGEGDDIRDDDSLFVSGRLDSITAIDLIMQLEKDFGLDFSRMDFDVGTIDSVAAISHLVHESRAA